MTLNLPPNGGFFDWGDQVKFTITVTDPEDGTIDCDDVQLQSILGHDTHGHPLDQYTGCDGHRADHAVLRALRGRQRVRRVRGQLHRQGRRGWRGRR